MMNKSRCFLSIVMIVFVFTNFLVWMSGCKNTNDKTGWVIGFSQVTVKEPWRVIFNENLTLHTNIIRIWHFKIINDLFKYGVEF